MSYVNIHTDEIKKMSNEELDKEIVAEMNAFLAGRYQAVRLENLNNLTTEWLKRNPPFNYTKGPAPSAYSWS